MMPEVDPLTRVRALLARVTYKPGAVFTVMQNPFTGFLIIGLTSEVQNATDPACKVQISMQVRIDPDQVLEMPDNEFYQMVLYTLVEEWETHEMQEWLKVDGKPVKDPHEFQPIGQLS
jgi:hypothetical protein